MNGTFTLHCRRTHPEAKPHQNLPTGRVRLVGEPRIGECLVIVGEHGGVVQTSTVRRFLSMPTRLVVETANSCYTLATAGEETLDEAA
jgi:hypothetical protein